LPVSFWKDQPLDATKFFIVLRTGLGRQSSKPSDSMHAKFPRYATRHVEADTDLLTEALE